MSKVKTEFNPMRSMTMGDLTGNRTNHPDLSTRYSSDPSRVVAIFDSGDETEEYDFTPDDDHADHLVMDPVDFFNSRTDLVDQLPSTVTQRFSQQGRK